MMKLITIMFDNKEFAIRLFILQSSLFTVLSPFHTSYCRCPSIPNKEGKFLWLPPLRNSAYRASGSWRMLPLLQKETKKDDLRPISLTPSIFKLTEDFVVTAHVKPAVLRVLDPSQFGAIPKSSTTLTLLEMFHVWLQGTYGNGSTIRTLRFDYKKAIDLIDHSILVRKLRALPIPPSVNNWIRSLRIKLSESCISEWGTVPTGVF